MQTDQEDLQRLLAKHPTTSGMYVRVRGDHLIAGREETNDNARSQLRDCIRLTRLGPKTYGLSIKRHTGRWERTPFSGTLRKMVEAVWSFMQHLVMPV